MNKETFWFILAAIILFYIIPELFPNSIIVLVIIIAVTVLMFIDLIHKYIQKRWKK